MTARDGALRQHVDSRYYQVNVTACSWGEIRRAVSPGSFIGFMPIIAVFKLLHRPMAGGDKIPHEVDLKAVEGHVARSDPQLRALIEKVEALGFVHFVTWLATNMAHPTIITGLMNRDHDAYGVVWATTQPTGTRVICDFGTTFNNGDTLDTTAIREAAAINMPARFRKHLVLNATPELLWEAHKAKVAQLSQQLGGVLRPVSPERFEKSFHTEWAEKRDFHVERGTWVLAE